MEYTLAGDVIKIGQPEIDIYDAVSLKEVLEGCSDRECITIDMAIVEYLSTPAIQVVISALKTIKGLKIEGLSNSIKRDLFLLGVEL
ncbi:MAG: STAS domain-containing protein [Thermodesulfobacteriota bacterium]